MAKHPICTRWLPVISGAAAAMLAAASVLLVLVDLLVGRIAHRCASWAFVGEKFCCAQFEPCPHIC